MKHSRLILLIIILAAPLSLFAQNMITGVVTDSKSEPIIGATVQIKGTQKGTITDLDGKFKLKGPAKGTLVITFIGYKKKEVPISKSLMQIELEDDSQMLDEVVAIGYVTMKKSDLTGSVSVVNMKDVENTSVNSIDQALGGRISGLSVISPDGQPGSEASFTIRGTGSMNGGSPLFVIDGFPQEDASFSSLNPDDIESLTVLKDASSTAIYGSRGANGVILVTTKKGQQDKPTISYKGNYGVQTATKKMEVLDAYDFVKMQCDLSDQLLVKKMMGLASSYNATGWMQSTYLLDRDLESYRDAKTIDWQDKLFRNAITQNHTLSVSGKTAKSNYYISLNYSNQDGLIKTTGFDRYSGRISLNQDVNKNLRIGVNANYSITSSYGTTASGETSAGQALMNNLYMYRPTSWNDKTLYDLENNIRDRGYDGEGDPYPGGNLERINPYISTTNEQKTSDKNELSFNTFMEYKFLKNFVLKVTGGYSDRIYKDESFYNEMTLAGTPETAKGLVAGPNGNLSTSKYISLLNENTITYKNVFKKKHAVSILGGFTLQKTKSDNFGYTAQQVPNAELGVKSLELGTLTSATSGGSQTALMSYLGRFDYSYSSKYLLTLTFRSDGSSKFANGHKWGVFPSGALAWRFTGEKFMKKLKNVINDGKLKTSLGYAGNNRVGDFASLATITATTNDRFVYNGDQLNTIGAYPSSIINTELTWEKTGTLNLGLELGLFNNKIRMEADYYKRNTTNLLLKSAIPTNCGFSSMQRNVGEIQNEGFEFEFNTENIRTRNFRWSTSFNISFNKNKVLSFASGEKSILTGVKFLDEAYIAQVGAPVAQYFGYVADGIYQLEDFDIMQTGQTMVNTQGETVPVLRYTLKSDLPYAERSREYTLPGYIKYKDLNGDGVVDTNDRVIIGNPYPKHVGGFTNNFDYKNFSLNVFFTWSYGAKILYGTPLAMTNVTDYRAFGLNRFEYLKDYWTEDNPYAKYPSLVTGGSRNMSTANLEDGSYLRLKNISLGYNLPRKFTKMLGISSLRLNVSAQNIWTWTKYVGQDPEVSANYSALTPMYDNSSYPRTKNITFGINASL